MIEHVLNKSIAFLLVLSCCLWVNPTWAKESSIEMLLSILFIMKDKLTILIRIKFVNVSYTIVM